MASSEEQEEVVSLSSLSVAHRGPQMAVGGVPRTGRTTTPGSGRFGTLSHHSFFSRHNPQPHRVRHLQGLNGKPVCVVNDEWYGYTPLCPHPLIRSQVPARVTRSSSTGSSSSLSGRAAVISEGWRGELKDLADRVRLLSAAASPPEETEQPEDVPCRKTQYSSQSGRIIPATSWRGKKHGVQKQSPTHNLDGAELRVLELLCQILQTDSLSMVQQWLLLANDREKSLVQGLLQQAVGHRDSLNQSCGPELLPLTSEHLPDHVFLSSARRAPSPPADVCTDQPERIEEAEVLMLHPEETVARFELVD